MKAEHKRIMFIMIGIGFLLLFYFMPELKPAVDPSGQEFSLTQSAKAGIGLFMLAGTWWVFEVIPIGATSLAIGILQPLLNIRSATDAMKDFMDPTVMFILGSLMIGLAFTKSGLTKRIAYKMLTVIGEKTKLILLGVFVMTALLTHVMAHTAVAATMFPILMAILALYGEGDKPTRFGKALFIGMAWTAGAGSMATLLGGARNPAAVGFYQEFTGQTISFVDFSLHLAPFGWLTVFLCWFLLLFLYKPEKESIPGLREKAGDLYKQMGPITFKEIFVVITVGLALTILVLQSFVPALAGINKSIPLVAVGVIFFLTKVLTVEDLEKAIPWNIVLLFSGAMSIGFALWQTGAAQWIAVNWLSMLKDAHWLVFVLGIAILMSLMTNFIMNVAAIACILPVALVMSTYLGVNSEMIVYAGTAMAALPFLLLVGAAPNAIAYQSRQFSTGEFFVSGIPATIMVVGVVALFALIIWPVIGLSPLIK